MDGGAVLTHRLDGEGETLLILNGGMMSIPSWEPIVARLTGDYRVLRCDFRGQLMTPGEAPTSFDQHAADVVRLLDSLDVSRVHVLGASFGAQVGLLLAALHPERLRSLIVVTASDTVSDPMRRGGERLQAVIREILEGGDRGRLHDLLVEEVYSEAYATAHRDELDARRAQMAALPDAWFVGLQGLLHCLDNMDLRPRLGAIACPCLVVLAGKDRVMPVERGRELAKAIPGARLEIVEDSGHALVVERESELVDLCLGFLREVSES